MDDTVEAYMDTAAEYESASEDPEKGSTEAYLKHTEEPSNNSSQGEVAEGLDMDVDMQGSNASNIVSPFDGTGSSTTSLEGNVVKRRVSKRLTVQFPPQLRSVKSFNSCLEHP